MTNDESLNVIESAIADTEEETKKLDCFERQAASSLYDLNTVRQPKFRVKSVHELSAVVYDLSTARQPDSLFPSFQEPGAIVHRDSYVEVARAFYEVPAELVCHQVWVRWDSRCVRVFNDRMEQVQIHTRIEPGQFSRVLGSGGLHAPVLSSCRYWISRAAVLDEECGQWAQAAFETRGAESLRSIMGLCGLIKRHSATAINTACAKALKSRHLPL
jgi:hypothetical protein